MELTTLQSQEDVDIREESGVVFSPDESVIVGVDRGEEGEESEDTRLLHADSSEATSDPHISAKPASINHLSTETSPGRGGSRDSTGAKERDWTSDLEEGAGGTVTVRCEGENRQKEEGNCTADEIAAKKPRYRRLLSSIGAAFKDLCLDLKLFFW